MDGVPYVRVCVQRERTGWEGAFPPYLTGSGGSLGGVKANSVGLDVNGVTFEENKK